MSPVVLAGIGYHHRFDGAARSFLSLLARLPDAGYRPLAVFLGEGVCTEAYREAGVDVRVMEADAGFDRFNKQWLEGGLWRARTLSVGLPRLARQVARLVRDERVAIAHFNESRALLSLGWAPRLAGIPTVLHVRGSLRPLPSPLRVTVQAVPDRLVLVGAALLSEIAAPFRSKSSVIYNSVSIPDADGGPSAEDAARPLRVVTLAAFEPFKGYHHLATAAALVTADLAPRRVEFRWFGNTVDPGYLSHLRGLLDSVGVSDVQIRDWVPDVTEELRAADLVVLPTVDDETIVVGDRRTRIRSSEGVPRCLLEAAAFGRATVATRVGGIPEAVRDGISGVLVTPSDPAGLAAAITGLLRDPDRRRAMGQSGREHVSMRFSHETLVEKVTAVYEELRRSPAKAAA